MSSTAILSPGAGYAIVLSISIGFAVVMVGITKLQNRYSVHKQSQLQEFASASHSVKPGLVATAIVSSWTWAATLLTSSAQAFSNGIGGGWFYGAGATVQIFLFSMNSVMIKRNAPRVHTFLEVVRCRWGTAAHLVFLFFSLLTSILVSAMLCVGGSDTVTALTGASTQAVCVLMPLGVACYILVGGLRASFFADYIHTAVLYIIILYFMFNVYTSNEKIGSIQTMYEKLQQAGVEYPIEGNKNGSYLTFRSKSGLIFMALNLITNLGTVFNDQAYWQRAIASRAETAVSGYMLGGSAWLSIPLAFATCMGLAGAVLRGDADWPGLTPAEVSAGLPAAAAAQTLLGSSGAAVLLILLFLAVTSATAAELCAVSTLLTYDVYLPYIKPHATDKETLFFDHCAIVFFACVMAILGIALFYAGISLGWLYNATGIFVASAVLPIAYCIMWKKANRIACMTAAVLGCALGVTAWLVTAASLNDGVVTIATSQQDYPMLTGSVTSFGVSLIISTLGSLFFPENYSYDDTRALHAHSEASEDLEPTTPSEEDKEAGEKATVVPKFNSESSSLAEGGGSADELSLYKRKFNLARNVSVPLFVILLILIPIPLATAGGGYISSLAGFKAYVVVCFLWIFYGIGAVVIYPLVEYRKELGDLCRNVVQDLRGKRIPREA
ncbi:sodium:solute symporter family protein [Sporobolomyces salmoneus]|uniref:sodium:solute symporter family protein n=1 Tax=Sporobolomyces salmoneus TaxID=183962 RepID=UPI00316D9BD3